MDFFNKKDLTPGKILKFALVLVAGIIVLSLLFQMLGSTISRVRNSAYSSVGYAPAYNGYSKDMAEQSASPLSIRNVLPIPPGQPAGNDAEEFEVTDYSATIETARKEKTCDKIAGLKQDKDVIFESSNSYDRGCNFTFKVLHARTPEILKFIKGLDPREMSENVYTIKRQVDDFTSEIEILTKKLQSIDKTLQSALRSYDEITALATRTQNAEALAKIIDSKINIIERLTAEQVRASSELERLNRSKDEQLDRLKYTFFNVNVYEIKYVDFREIGDSWKSAIRDLSRSLNLAIQFATVKLLVFILWLVPILVYAFVFIVIAKYSWRFARKFWDK